ncbi:hypothetical protein [Candidatus Pelagibacter sp. HIMB1509]|uniref:hypothetical protein n=1 Tax=Candidatus Pelagibacter sp. HIMB1509 TaxID=3413339 RepID=UPI003F85B49E
MIIKDFKPKIIKINFDKKKFLLLFILIFLLSTFSLYLLYTGAKLQKNQTAAHFKELISDLKREKFSFLENYFKSLIFKPDNIYLDINFKNILKLESVRNNALKRGYISQEDQMINVNAKLKKDKENFNVDVSPTGFLLDMIGDKKKRAYKIKVKKNETLYSMSEFKLLPPKSRFYLTELIGQTMSKTEGLININYFFVNLFLNGENLGTYAVEEHLTKELIERNNKRNGIIFSYNQDNGKIKIFNKNKYLKNGEFNKKQINYINYIWNNSIQDPKKLIKHINIDKFAKYFAVIDLMDGFHALENNSLFYLDPISLEIEPIIREFNSYRYVDGPPSYDWISIEQFSQNENNFSFYKKFYSTLFHNKKFLNAYIKNLDRLSEKTYLDNFFKNNKKLFNKQLSFIHKSYPGYNFPKEYMYLKQNHIQKHLSEKKILLSRFNDIKNEIEIENYSKYPLKIIKLINAEENFLKEFKNYIIYPGQINKINLENERKKNFLNLNFEIFFKINNSQNADISSTPVIKDLNIINLNNYFYNDENLEKYFYLDNKNMTIVPRKKKTVINENIFLPKNYKFKLLEGYHLDLVNGSTFISKSNFILNGKKDKRILISSSDNSSPGILILDTVDENILNFVTFENFNNISKKNRKTLGAINVYNSKIILDNCIFENNKSEDSLNIVNSDFKIFNTIFKNSSSDSLDLDFSDGVMENVSFINSKNDAIDMSGGNVKMQNIYITGAGDKAISSGEKNILTGNDIVITKNAIGIASKDLSNIKLTRIMLENNKLAISAYQKKKAYGPSKIYLYEHKLTKNNKDFLIEEKSKLFFDDNEVEIQKYKNVELLMYGNLYGAKTIK